MFLSIPLSTYLNLKKTKKIVIFLILPTNGIMLNQFFLNLILWQPCDTMPVTWKKYFIK